MGTLEERYLEATRRLRARVDYLEEMARWKEDLASRLWRSRAVLRISGEALYDIAALEAEVRMFNAISQKLKGTSDAGGQ
jgi:hypothetical protein